MRNKVVATMVLQWPGIPPHGAVQRAKEYRRKCLRRTSPLFRPRVELVYPGKALQLLHKGGKPR